MKPSDIVSKILLAMSSPDGLKLDSGYTIKVSNPLTIQIVQNKYIVNILFPNEHPIISFEKQILFFSPTINVTIAGIALNTSTSVGTVLVDGFPDLTFKYE